MSPVVVDAHRLNPYRLVCVEPASVRYIDALDAEAARIYAEETGSRVVQVRRASNYDVGTHGDVFETARFATREVA